ncbi:MAG: hypothetical protein KGO96_12260 [Elusimicrobia bacterium]|nr:hypothetical protein [Elusimicrobiota bacterium]MDE2426670.1 hypothetical protein [Elusimicrobiota bacterium]
MTDTDLHAQLFRRLHGDRVLAHRVIFPHRHSSRTQPFHEAMIRDWHMTGQRKLLQMAFRGSAKSTIAEEALCLLAGFREFKNGLLVGETYERACERLHAIRHEMESNERLAELFGALPGATWSDGELVTSAGVRLLAVGRNQALRGVKFEDTRPDAVFCDDIENNESVADEKRIMKVRRWFFGELLPACDPDAFVRVAATPLHPDALAVRLLAAKGWKSKIYPIEYLDAEGQRRATWPDRFPLEKIDEIRDQLSEQGLIDDFEREYLCQIIRKSDHAFVDVSMPVMPQVRTWQAVYAMFDPARTVNKGSATTGFASWSWMGADRLVVWDAWGRKLMPDEIVTAMFDVGLSQDLPPVWIGVEEDGLNEFLLQPIRSEQARRGQSIPFRSVRAPKGKLDFIRGLQPYFRAGRVSFAKELPDLVSQLLRFPSGAIDVPNALAYALRLRPGAPIHEHFATRHVFEDLLPLRGQPVFLAANAARNLTTGVLVQYTDQVLYVLADWVREGPPSDNLAQIVAEAQMLTGKKVPVCAAPNHFDQYENVGLIQAAARVPVTTQRAGTAAMGGPALAAAFQREVRGFAAVRVSSSARWTLNALSGGYCRGLKNGVITPDAEPGPYRVLMEGLEAFCALTDGSAFFDDDDDIHYATARGGHRYMSARR